MPRLSQLMVRTALFWLATGFVLGGLVLWNKGVPLHPWLWTLRMAHVHALLVGWMVQLAYGVAFWIMPRLDASGSRGNEALVWWCYGTLNAGVALATIHDPLAALLRAGWLWIMPVLAGGLYLAATLAFVANAWPRIVPFRTLPRPGRSSTDST